MRTWLRNACHNGGGAPAHWIIDVHVHVLTQVYICDGGAVTTFARSVKKKTRKTKSCENTRIYTRTHTYAYISNIRAYVHTFSNMSVNVIYKQLASYVGPANGAVPASLARQILAHRNHRIHQKCRLHAARRQCDNDLGQAGDVNQIVGEIAQMLGRVRC